MTATPPGRPELADMLGPTVAEHGLFLEKVTVSGPQNRRLLRIVVDVAEGTDGVDSEVLEAVSRALSAQMDELDSISGAYTLEISTPGVDRPLTEARHYRRNLGRLVAVTTEAGSVTGRVLDVSDTEPATVTLEVTTGKGSKATTAAREFSLDEVTTAHVQIEMRGMNTTEGHHGN